MWSLCNMHFCGHFRGIWIQILWLSVVPAPAFPSKLFSSQALQFHKAVQFPKVLGDQAWAWQFFIFAK